MTEGLHFLSFFCLSEFNKLWDFTKQECMLSHFSHVWLYDPINFSPPDSSVHEILQPSILKWVIIPFCRASSWPRDQFWVSHITGRFFTPWATREIPKQGQRAIKLSFCYVNEVIFGKTLRTGHGCQETNPVIREPELSIAPCDLPGELRGWRLNSIIDGQ